VEGTSNNNYLDDDLSMIPGTPENDDDQSIDHSKRKIRISIKGDTTKYRKYRKDNRNAGLEYITNKGKTVKSRCSVPLSDCRAKCSSKIDDNLREELFRIYWSMNSYERRVAYISGLITFSEKKTTRKRTETPEKQRIRNNTRHYFVPKDNSLESVCQGCFLKIFGETSTFLKNICKQKLSSPANKTTPDKRGRGEPKNKKSVEDIALIKKHIKKLPSYESHYCRKETAKKYLPPYFTLQCAYDDYVKSVEKPVSRSVYEKHFKESGLKIKNTKKDTCAQCDRIKMQLSNHLNEENKKKLLTEKNEHQNSAEEAYNSKRMDASTVLTNTCVLAFDLQQCLPTPSLESSVVFYKRQLWTYNLTIRIILFLPMHPVIFGVNL